MAILTRLQTRAVIRHRQELPLRFYRYTEANHSIRHWDAACTRNVLGWTVTALAVLGACVGLLRAFVA